MTQVLVKIQKINEVFLKLESDFQTISDINEHFSFFAPNYQFSPQYKYGNWDGKIRLLTRNNLIYAGLYHKLIDFLESNDIEYLIINNQYYQSPNITLDIEPQDVVDFVSGLNLPFQVRDYQYSGVYECLKNYRKIIKSATGSGKSLIIYIILKFFLNIEAGNILLITSSPSLCKQFIKDFKDYGFADIADFVNTPDDIKKKNLDNIITICNYHLIAKKDRSFFKDYAVVICDEVHKATSDSITNIMNKLDNALYRFGFSGSINEEAKINPLIITGLFGEIKTICKSHELISSGQLAPVHINCIELQHNPKKEFDDYNEENKYIYSLKVRNDYIIDLALEQEKNTLILYKNTEQGEYIYNQLKLQNEATFWIYGKTNVEERETIRKFTNEHDNVIIVASYQVFQEGINIKNLNVLIYAQAGKGFERNIQSIGRILRTKEDKSKATVYDLSDNLYYSKNHQNNRIKIYNNEKFPVTITKDNLYAQ